MDVQFHQYARTKASNETPPCIQLLSNHSAISPSKPPVKPLNSTLHPPASSIQPVARPSIVSVNLTVRPSSSSLKQPIPPSPSPIPPIHPIIPPVPGTTLFDSHFPNERGYTSYLKRVTDNSMRPFLVDVNAYQQRDYLEFYIVISSMHLDNYRTMQHINYQLLFNGVSFSNQFRRQNTDIGYSVLSFVVPTKTPYSRNAKVFFSLNDTELHLFYKDVYTYVRYPNPDPLPLAICAYVSDYNSIDELRMWIAYYRVQKVSLVIFYVAVPMPELEKEFKELVQSGFLQLVDFTWPRRKLVGPIQTSNQQAQMNSCFYQYKYEIKTMIICDTDEFVYSRKYPDLSQLVSVLSKEYPSYNVFHMLSNIVYNKNGDLRFRQEHLHNGTLFDAYQYFISYKKSGRKKMIIRSSFTGTLGTHVCQYCKTLNPVPELYVSIAHFKCLAIDSGGVYDPFMSKYTSAVRRMIQSTV